MIRKVLQGELVVIRATYEYLIKNYISRPYMPGLLRLLTHSLAIRDEWKLLRYLLNRAIYQKEPFLSNRNVAAIVNYATSLSIKLYKGQGEISQGNSGLGLFDISISIRAKVSKRGVARSVPSISLRLSGGALSSNPSATAYSQPAS